MKYFSFQSLASTFWFTCDCFTDLVFAADLVVQLRTGYLEQGLMVYDSRKLAGHYLNSKAFMLDLVSMTPLDLLQLRFGPNPMLRFPRFFKVGSNISSSSISSIVFHAMQFLTDVPSYHLL